MTKTESQAGNGKASPSRKRWLKKLAIAFAILLALPVLAILLLPWYSSAFTSLITTPLEQSLGRKVTIDGLSLNLLTSKMTMNALAIKDADPGKNFISLQQFAVDFSIWPLLSGNIVIPKAEISGVKIKIAIDRQGKANYQSILDHLALKKASAKPLQKTKKTAPSTVLPLVRANIDLNDINITFVDEQQQLALEIVNCRLSCDIDGLENIRHQWQWDKIKLLSGAKLETGSGYNFQGQSSLKLVAGAPMFSSKGTISFPDIYMHTPAQSLDNRSVSLDYQIQADMATKALQFHAKLDSDYLTIAADNWRIVGGPTLATMPVTKWHGDLQARLDVKKLYGDFAPILGRFAGERQQQLAESVSFSLKMRGQTLPGLTIVCQAQTPFIALPALTKKTQRAEIKAQTKPTTSPKATPSPASPQASLLCIAADMRKFLQRLRIDCLIAVDEIVLNQANRLKKFRLRINSNQEKSPGIFEISTKAQINDGDFALSWQCDWRQANPQCQLSYRLKRVPYRIALFMPLTDLFERTPVLAQIRFSETAIPFFDIDGELAWRGLDVRAIKRTLVSRRPTLLRFPKGVFDLGIKLGENLAAVKQELQQKLSELNQAGKKLISDKGPLLEKCREWQNQLQKINEALASLAKKKEEVSGIIDKLKPLASWNPATREKLEQYQGQYKEYDSQIQRYQKAKADLRQKLDTANAQLAGLQERLKGLQQRIADYQQRLQGKLQLGPPFQFDFSKMAMRLAINNSNPWPGQGGLPELARHPNSAVKLQVKFAADSGRLPRIAGIYRLDGGYALQVQLPNEVQQRLNSRIPALGEAVRKSNGLRWTDQGVQPNPLDFLFK